MRTVFERAHLPPAWTLPSTPAAVSGVEAAAAPAGPVKRCGVEVEAVGVENLNGAWAAEVAVGGSQRLPAHSMGDRAGGPTQGRRRVSGSRFLAGEGSQKWGDAARGPAQGRCMAFGGEGPDESIDAAGGPAQGRRRALGGGFLAAGVLRAIARQAQEPAGAGFSSAAAQGHQAPKQAPALFTGTPAAAGPAPPSCTMQAMGAEPADAPAAQTAAGPALTASPALAGDVEPAGDPSAQAAMAVGLALAASAAQARDAELAGTPAAQPAMAPGPAAARAQRPPPVAASPAPAASAAPAGTMDAATAARPPPAAGQARGANAEQTKAASIPAAPAALADRAVEAGDAGRAGAPAPHTPVPAGHPRQAAGAFFLRTRNMPPAASAAAAALPKAPGHTPAAGALFLRTQDMGPAASPAATLLAAAAPSAAPGGGVEANGGLAEQPADMRDGARGVAEAGLDSGFGVGLGLSRGGPAQVGLAVWEQGGPAASAGAPGDCVPEPLHVHAKQEVIEKEVEEEDDDARAVRELDALLRQVDAAVAARCSRHAPAACFATSESCKGPGTQVTPLQGTFKLCKQAALAAALTLETACWM